MRGSSRPRIGNKTQEVEGPSLFYAPPTSERILLTYSSASYLSPQHEPNLARDDLWDRASDRGGHVGVGGSNTLAIRYGAGCRSRAACSFQSPASRGRPWHRLPLLPHLG